MAEFKIFSKNDVRGLEVLMKEETVRTEDGVVQCLLGNIQRETPSLSISRFFKVNLVAQKLTKPTYAGSGKLLLEPTLGDFHKIHLEGETLVLERGAFYACEQGIELFGRNHKEIPGFKPSEHFTVTIVRGTGTVIVHSPGPVEILELKKERLVVDGSFVVARSDTLSASFKRSEKPVVGSLAWGDGVETTLEGSGRVYLASLPYPRVLLQKNILKNLLSVKISKKIFREVKNGLLVSLAPFMQPDDKRY